MLKTARRQTVSLEACGGGAVMLSLDDGEGHVFRQALDARDAGKLIELSSVGSVWGTVSEHVLCQGDLVATLAMHGQELHLAWHDERGGDGLVRLDRPGKLVLEEALRSYCRMLMRSPEDLP